MPNYPERVQRMGGIQAGSVPNLNPDWPNRLIPGKFPPMSGTAPERMNPRGMTNYDYNQWLQPFQARQTPVSMGPQTWQPTWQPRTQMSGANIPMMPSSAGYPAAPSRLTMGVNTDYTGGRPGTMGVYAPQSWGDVALGRFAPLPQFLTPSAQYYNQMGPTARQQYQGYAQATMGWLPEESLWRQRMIAPPGGSPIIPRWR